LFEFSSIEFSRRPDSLASIRLSVELFKLSAEPLFSSDSLPFEGTTAFFPSPAGIRFMSSSGLNGTTPVLLNPEQIISGEQVFNHAFEKSLEKLNFVTTLPGDDWMKLWHS
jgi:hypothetical protein